MINPPINVNTRNRLAREQAPVGTVLLCDWARQHGISYHNFHNRMYLLPVTRSKAGRYFIPQDYQPELFLAKLKEKNYKLYDSYKLAGGTK